MPGYGVGGVRVRFRTRVGGGDWVRVGVRGRVGLRVGLTVGARVGVRVIEVLRRTARS